MGPTILLLLTGCYVEVHMRTCGSETVEVDHDFVVDDLSVSADDVLARIGGAFPFEAVDPDGAAVSGGVEAARGAGPAILTEWFPVDQVMRGTPGFWHVRTDEQGPVHCRDDLQVPLDVALATDDGALAFSLEGLVEPRTTGEGTEPVFAFVGDVDPLAVDAASSPEATATLSLDWKSDELYDLTLWIEADDEWTTVLAVH